MATKKALLIGINYQNTSAQLNGCINDCIQWWSILQDVYGFDEKDIVFLRDDKSDFRPTRQRIITELTNLVNSKATNSFICYSGHGTQVPDTNNDEIDKLDECIVPSDFQTAGILTDDIINGILKNNISSTLAVFDCCRSGTILDIAHNGINKSVMPSNTQIPSAKIICFSGCRDNQDAAEVYNLNNKLPQGALTISLIHSLRKLKYYPKLNDLYNSITSDIKFGGLTQVPQISSTFALYEDTPFMFETTQNQSNLLLSEINTLKLQVTQLTSDKTQLQIKVTQITADRTRIQSQIIQLQTQITQLTADRNRLQTQLQTQIQTQNSPNIQNTQQHTQVIGLIAQNNAFKAQISQLVRQLTQLRTQNMQLTTQMNALRRR